ncbi:N-acetylglucosamine/diacetylchitobiose ABC transporter substrate-binding protein [Streptomyces spiramenti]|uniref:Carbohydrate ABC transporter, N-acetylglucosamine/diacetylchitobiose-binding protein n=1 Tax=Streptomyces spiramenti TaxID=2720606 RepID=A0ABX1AMM2_9ACTN|nr:N-acetylglucosamine/diacetylchitobiose ABC transporter substrate-binding protein [Streptomyces spiramenti]NJP65868.1 carbohydrate ABC transporter, N-acetylglucosamine/diacetylchitobiose-binding protein [Streptomyces spiramenti]
MTSSSHLNRRTLLKRSALAGAFTVPGVAALTSCASGGGGNGGDSTGSGEVSDRNPFGVAEDGGVEVVIFDGGFGDEYARDTAKLFEESYGSVTLDSTQEISQLMQPRLVGGNPPDMINNSGANQMPHPALIRDNQIADLTELFDAPSWDDPDVPVRDTLLPGTIEVGQYGDDASYHLNYVYTVHGTWYSKRFLNDTLEEEFPQTWDEMIRVCEKARRDHDVYGWTYAGQHARYLAFSMLPMAVKVGGKEVMEAIDRLEPDAWKADAVVATFEAFEELAARGLVLPGTPGIDHIDSQTEWAQGRALFIPNGSWVENESKEVIPDDFDLAVGAPTGLDSSDVLPYGVIYAAAGEPFLVPQNAKNRAAGMEYLRMMLSNDMARNFTDKVASLTCVAGSADDLDLPPGLASAQQAIQGAGDNIIVPRFRDWYAELFIDHMGVAMGQMMAGELTAAQATDRIQQAADRIAQDDNVEKYL